MSSERRIGVIGAGTMGAGIAQAAAQAGFVVETRDTNPDLVKRAHASIGDQLARQVEKGRISRAQRDAAVARLRVAAERDAFAGAALVIEAVPEDLGLKRRILSELDAALPPTVVLATNTSSLSVGALAEGMRHPQRFCGLHFFNPAPVMKLVELVRGPQTDDQTVLYGVAFARALGKTPIKVKDSPGFVVNRVARPFYLESLALLEAGAADVPTIDRAVKSVGGFPMGPFELLDLIGLDVNLAVTKSVYEGFGRPKRFAPSAIQERLVGQGRLGRKSGRGFYDYANSTPTPAYETAVRGSSERPGRPAFEAFAAALGKPGDGDSWLFGRVLLAIINEAARAAESIALPREVDVGMKLGLNYPSGPLELADLMGLDVVLEFMLAQQADDPAGRFDPAPLLLSRVSAGELGEKTAQGFLRHAL